MTVAMNIHELDDTPPWEWPRNAGATITAALSNPRTSAAERLIAANLAGNIVVINDDIAGLLMSTLRNANEPDDLRARAAISLGPILEQADTHGFEEDEYFRQPIKEATFHQIQQTLEELYADERQPKLVRRRILEASVRATADWHVDAIRTAWLSSDDEWKLTAVFGMRYVPGFDKEILKALESRNADIHHEAVRAAGEREIDAAWPHVVALIENPGTGKDLLIDAIGAAAAIRPREAGPIVVDFADSEDEDISEAANEAIAAGETFDDDESDEDDDKEDEEDEPF
jgi:hypothetical protein